MLKAARYKKDARRYSQENLHRAVSLVKSKRLTVSKAAREFLIPRKTLDDHVKSDMKLKPGPATMLSESEELALKNYIIYMARQGFPMNRNMIRQYVIAICKNDHRNTLFNIEKGPSDKWFRSFLTRHKELSEKEPEMQDRGRNRMANQRVMNQYFGILSETVKRLGLENKPSSIFNCDETGWSGKEKDRGKVFGVKGQHCYQQKMLTTGHITAHLCIAADGRVLPTFLIFEKSLPHTAYKDGVPPNWLYGFSDSGYMDSHLFQAWLKEVFIPNCGRERPVLLIMDNHDSHINIEVVKLARDNGIELVGLPPHTTHILQPLDVSINGPLKSKFSTLAKNLGFINKNQVLSKAKFPVVLSNAIDQFCSPGNVKEAFRKTGIFPLNPEAIDKTQLTPTHSTTVASASSCVTSSAQPPVSFPAQPSVASSASPPQPSSSAQPTPAQYSVPSSSRPSVASSASPPQPSSSAQPTPAQYSVPSSSPPSVASSASPPQPSSSAQSMSSICITCGT